jgi:hypothetical protein
VPNSGARATVLKDCLIQIVDALRELRLPYMVIGAFGRMGTAACDARS